MEQGSGLGHRIYVRKKYLGIYRELINERPGSPKIFNENKDLFTLCVTIGYRDGKANDLENRDMLLWSGTLEKNQMTTFKAIALKENEGDPRIFENIENVFRLIEKYADQGMDILVENVFEDYIEKKEDGILTIVYNQKDRLYLQKSLLHFIDNELNIDENLF